MLSTLQNDNVSKVIEVSLDLIELLLSHLPESIFNNIDTLIKILLKHMQSKKESVNLKANENLNLSIKILTADVLLPHLISILVDITDDNSLLSTKISGLEVLNVLLKE